MKLIKYIEELIQTRYRVFALSVRLWPWSETKLLRRTCWPTERKKQWQLQGELADVEEAPARGRAGARCSLRLGFLFFFFSSTCLPTIRAETSSPDAAACAISSCLSNAVAAAVLFQSNSTAIAACRADVVSMLGTDT